MATTYGTTDDKSEPLVRGGDGGGGIGDGVDDDVMYTSTENRRMYYAVIVRLVDGVKVRCECDTLWFDVYNDLRSVQCVSSSLVRC